MKMTAPSTDPNGSASTKTKGTKKSPAAITRRNEFVTKYYQCVEKVARRLARRLPAHVDLDELMSAGAVGLLDAAERFDPERANRFETFAEARIRGAMLDDLRAR